MNQVPVLDPKPLQDLLDMGASEDLVQELIALFREDVPPRIAALEAATGAGDFDRVAGEAHQLKGALGNLGLQKFAALAAQLETLAREGRGDAGLVAALPGCYDEASRALEAAFPSA